MSLTAGAVSQVAVSQSTATLNITAATGGTGPYTQQLYRSTTSGFTPGGGNLVAGATSLGSFVDSGLVPNTTYYYKEVYTDTGAGSATITSAQLAVQTSVPSQNQNAFAMSAQLGMIDLMFNPNTVTVIVDSSQATPILAGAAVKMVDSAGGVPKVVACTASTDEVLGFVNYNIKNVSFLAGDSMEISMSGNVIYLYSTGAIARGAQVSLDITSPGGVSALVSTNNIVGWAFDKAATAGVLFRVFLKTPSYLFAP